MVMRDAEIEDLIVLLSPERLEKLIALTGDRREAIALHQETLAVGASLMSIIATVEIAIRNAVCMNLNQYFGMSDWLIRPPAPFQWKSTEIDKGAKAKDSAQRAEYSKLDPQQRAALDALAYPNGRPVHETHSDRARKRRMHLPVSQGKIIAEMTLHFWKRLYGPEYEHSLWKPSLKKTFPHKRVKRAEVAAHLENIYQARNRLAHHEPVLRTRFVETMASIEYIIQRLGTSVIGPHTALAKLLEEPIERVLQQAKALHDRLDAYRV